VDVPGTRTSIAPQHTQCRRQSSICWSSVFSAQRVASTSQVSVDSLSLSAQLCVPSLQLLTLHGPASPFQHQCMVEGSDCAAICRTVVETTDEPPGLSMTG
jgi:hypothetical protein